MSKTKRNPIGYWYDQVNGWSKNKKLVVFIFESLFPAFEARREYVTEEMVRLVMERYNLLTDSNLTMGQLRFPVRLAFSKRRLNWPGQSQYDRDDREYLKYKKELNNK